MKLKCICQRIIDYKLQIMYLLFFCSDVYLTQVYFLNLSAFFHTKLLLSGSEKVNILFLDYLIKLLSSHSHWLAIVVFWWCNWSSCKMVLWLTLKKLLIFYMYWYSYCLCGVSGPNGERDYNQGANIQIFDILHNGIGCLLGTEPLADTKRIAFRMIGRHFGSNEI